MDIKKLTLAYFSPALTTKRILMNVVWGISLKNTPTEEMNLNNKSLRMRDRIFGPHELLVVGAPVYSGRLPQVQPGLLEHFRGQNTPAVAVVVYGNRAYEDALLELSDTLQNRGFVPMAAGAFVAQHSAAPGLAAGRPDVPDIQAANLFGRRVASRLSSLEHAQLADLEELQVPGERPYRDAPPPGGLVPVTGEGCTLCLQCYRRCPTDAIAYNNPKQTDPDKCIMCHCCVRRCPSEAREFTDPAFKSRMEALVETYGEIRLEPEMFF